MMIRILLALATSCLLAPWGSQVNSGPTDADSQRRIAALKAELTDMRKVLQANRFGEIQTSLAKLGEREQLQQIQCELGYGTPVVQWHAFGKLPSVGGWFSIAALSKFLSDAPENTRGRSDFYGIFSAPQTIALQTLPHVVPNPPMGEANVTRMAAYEEERKSTIRLWTDWLDKNHDSLRMLEPVGAGIESSPDVCREVLRHDPTNLVYPEPPATKGKAKRQ